MMWGVGGGGSHCPIRLLGLIRSDEAPSSFFGLMMLLGLDSAGEPNWGGSSLGGALGFLSALGLIDWASWGRRIGGLVSARRPTLPRLLFTSSKKKTVSSKRGMCECRVARRVCVCVRASSVLLSPLRSRASPAHSGYPSRARRPRRRRCPPPSPAGTARRPPPRSPPLSTARSLTTCRWLKRVRRELARSARGAGARERGRDGGREAARDSPITNPRLRQGSESGAGRLAKRGCLRRKLLKSGGAIIGSATFLTTHYIPY